MSNPTRNPTNPSNPPEPEPATARTDHSDGRWRVSAPKTRRRRVKWRVFFSKSRATRPDRRYIQIWQYARRSKRDLVRSGEIRGDPGWFRRFLVQIYWVFADSGDFFEDSGNVCRIRRLSQPTEPTRTPPEHHPNPKPTRPSDAGGRFRVPPPPTRRMAGRVRIGSKIDPPDPWTALVVASPLYV